MLGISLAFSLMLIWQEKGNESKPGGTTVSGVAYCRRDGKLVPAEEATLYCAYGKPPHIGTDGAVKKIVGIFDRDQTAKGKVNSRGEASVPAGQFHFHLNGKTDLGVSLFHAMGHPGDPDRSGKQTRYLSHIETREQDELKGPKVTVTLKSAAEPISSAEEAARQIWMAMTVHYLLCLNSDGAEVTDEALQAARKDFIAESAIVLDSLQMDKDGAIRLDQSAQIKARLEPLRLKLDERTDLSPLDVLPEEDDYWAHRNGELFAKEKAHEKRVEESRKIAVGLPEVLRGHEGPVTSLGVIPPGLLVTASEDGDARVWDLGRPGAPSVVLPRGDRVGGEGLRELFRRRPLGFPEGNGLLAVDADLGLVAMSDFASISVWDVKKPQGPPMRLKSKGSEFFGPDVFMVAGRLVSWNLSGSIVAWDAKRLDAPTLVRKGLGIPPTAFEVAPDGRAIAAGTDETLRVRDLARAEEPPRVLRGVDGFITRVAVAPDDRVVYARSGGDLRVWDLKNPGAKPMIFPGHKGEVSALVVSPEGRVISGGEDGEIRISGLGPDGGPPVTLKAHERRVSSLLLIPGDRLVSASLDCTIRVWDLKAPQAEPRIFNGHVGGVTALAIMPDGPLFSASDDGTVRVWDLD
jgi:WD40 repeat protein